MQKSSAFAAAERYMTPKLQAIINSSCILILRITSSLAADLLQLAEARPEVLIDFGMGCIRVGDGAALCLSTEHTRYVRTLGDIDFTKYQELQGIPFAAAEPAPSQPVMPPASLPQP